MRLNPSPSPSRRAVPELHSRGHPAKQVLLLYELAAGKNPFLREEPGAVARAHLGEEPPPLREAAPDCTTFLGEVVATLLRKKPEERFPSAAAVERVLAEGEASAWWRERRGDLLRSRERIPRVPVRRETALLGREEDLERLRGCWRRARNGEGNAHLVLGEAGIGKSRLVDAFLQEMGTPGAHVLYGSYPPSGGRGAIADAVIHRFGEERLAESLQALLPEAPSLAAPLAEALQGERRDGGAPFGQAGALQAALAHLLGGLAAEKPLLWVIEDLHFADADARALVLAMARALEGRRAFLLLTARPEFAGPELAPFARPGNFGRTTLGRLGEGEVALLLRERFRNEGLAERLGAKVAAASDGIPFFVVEMIRVLRQEGFVEESSDGTWTAAREVDRIPVPEAVRDLVGERLRLLSPAEREILDAGAVQGNEFDPDLVAEVLERKRVEVLRGLARLERETGAVRAAGRNYRFDHHQFLEVVHGALGPALLEEYHAETGRAMERRSGAAEGDPKDLDGALCAALADHFLRGAQGARALRYLEAGLSHLEGGYRNEAAIALADRALGVRGLVEGRDRVRLLLRKAARLDLAGLRERQRTAAEEAHRLATEVGDAEGEARAAAALGNVRWRLGRFAEAAEHFEGALAIARRAGDAHAEFDAVHGLGNVLQNLGRLPEAGTQCERAIELARALGNGRLEASATGNLGNILYLLGRFPEARALYERHLTMARALGHREGEANATGNLGMVALATGRHDEARVLLLEQLEIAQAIGDRQGMANATGTLGLVANARGRLAEAGERLERWAGLCREVGNPRSESSALGSLGLLLGRLGAAEEGRKVLREALDLARGIGARRHEGTALRRLALLEEEAGNGAAAEERFREALAVLREVGERREVAGVLGELGVLLAERGSPEEARACLVEARGLDRELGLPGEEALVLCGLALLSGGDPREAAAALAAHGHLPSMQPVMYGRFLLWKATHDREHLAEAKRLLDHLVDHSPADRRGPMLANVPLHRDIAAAAGSPTV